MRVRAALWWLAAAGTALWFGGCDNAVDYPNEQDLTVFPEDSAGRYFGRLEVDGPPKINSDGTEVYQFRRDVPVDPLPAGSGLGADVPPLIPADNGQPATRGRGPACYTGQPYRVLLQRGTGDGPRNLVIEAAGGGACFVDAQEPGDCLIPGSEARQVWPSDEEFTFLSANEARNPFTNDWDRVFLPYCDNSLFSADVNAVPAAGQPANAYRYYRGTQNFMAGLQIAKQTNPNPEKVLVAGFSAGGYGVVINLPVIREVFPNSAIYVYSDSGMLMGNRKDSPGFLEKAVNDFNARFYLPEECGDDCLADDTLFPAAAAFINKAEREGQPVRVGLATTVENFNIGGVFLQYGTDIEQFTQSFLQAFSDTQAATPAGSFAGFLIDGAQGTVDLVEPDPDSAFQPDETNKFDVTVNGTPLGEWITDFLSGSGDWQTVSDVTLP